MSGVEEGMMIAGLVGTGVNAVGKIASGYAEADAAQKSSELKAKQADELMTREGINESIMQKQGELSQKRFVTTWGDTGKEGAGIGAAIRMQADLSNNIALANRDAKFKADMIRAGAQIDTQLAGDNLTASWLGGAGSILTGAAGTYDYYRKYGMNSKA